MKRQNSTWFSSIVVALILCCVGTQRLQCSYDEFIDFLGDPIETKYFYAALAKAMNNDDVDELECALKQLKRAKLKPNVRVPYTRVWTPSQARMWCCSKGKDALLCLCPIAIGVGVTFASNGFGLLGTLAGKIGFTTTTTLLHFLCYWGLQKPLGGQAPSRHYDDVSILSGEFTLLTIAIMNGAYECVKYLYEKKKVIPKNEPFRYRNWLPRLKFDQDTQVARWKLDRNILNSCLGCSFACGKCHDVLEEEEYSIALRKVPKGRGEWRCCSCGHEWPLEDNRVGYSMTPLLASLLFFQATAERESNMSVDRMMRYVGQITLKSSFPLIDRPCLIPQHLITSTTCCQCIASCCTETCKDGLLCCFKCCSYNGQDNREIEITPGEYASTHADQFSDYKESIVAYIVALECEAEKKLRKKKKELKKKKESKKRRKRERKLSKKNFFAAGVGNGVVENREDGLRSDVASPEVRLDDSIRVQRERDLRHGSRERTAVYIDARDIPWHPSDFSDSGSVGGGSGSAAAGDVEEYSYYTYTADSAAALSGSGGAEVFADEAASVSRGSAQNQVGTISSDTSASSARFLISEGHNKN